MTLAWFLRYPNPYATHVLSTDTIHQSFNPQTQCLKVVRLHLKRGKLPVWSKRFLSHISESWIVETTEVDLRNGRMETRMRNLDHKRVLYVEERGSWSKLGENQYVPSERCVTKLRFLLGRWLRILRCWFRSCLVYFLHAWRNFQYESMMKMVKNNERE